MTRHLTRWLILLAGLYAAGLALWHMASTAVFVHEAVYIPAVVVDSKERPFDGALEMLQHGNMPWEGETAYQPYVRYMLFGRTITDDSLPDLDNREYANGEAVEIILHPQATHRRHLNKFKFLWAGDLLLLALGAILLIIARYLLRRRKKRIHHQPHREPAPAPAPPPAAPAKAEDKAPAAPRKRKRKASASTSSKSSSASKSSSSTRAKKSSADAAAKPKTTSKRRKKTTAESS